MQRTLVSFALLTCVAAASAAQFHFATPAEGAAVLTADDDYLRAMSPADPALRLKSTKPQTLAALKSAYAADVLEWNARQRARIDAVLGREHAKLDALARWLPARVDFVLVTREVEGGLPHTRGTSILLPAPLIDSAEPLDSIVVHELFHVLSRNNPARRDSLYALIGFQPCRVVEPQQYAARRITNPDAPTLAHFLPLTDDGREGLVPYLYAAGPVFDPAAGAQFVNQFRVGFLHVSVTGPSGATRCEPYAGDADPVLPLAAHKDVIDRKTGANTGYLIHPEETLADNFALLIAGSDHRVPSPWVLEKLQAWLEIPDSVLSSPPP